MSTFAITEIRAGWVTTQLRSMQGPLIVVGSYAPNDAIRDFVDAVASLATTSSATCTWHQEPDDLRWHFVRTHDHIDVLASSPRRSVECSFEWPRFASD